MCFTALIIYSDKMTQRTNLVNRTLLSNGLFDSKHTLIYTMITFVCSYHSNLSVCHTFGHAGGDEVGLIPPHHKIRIVLL